MLIIIFLTADYKRDLAANNMTTVGPSSTPKPAIKKSLFAPASPALSNNVSSAGIHKPSLRPPETGVFFFLDYTIYLTIISV